MEREESDLRPAAIVTIYSGRSYRGLEGCYVEIQNIQRSNTGRVTYGAARPITKDAMSKLISATMPDQENNYFSSKLHPENLLMFKPEKHNRKIVWWTKARKISMIFKKSLEIPNGKISMPALLFVVTGDILKIFALKENKRPTEKTTLYNAPLLNYYDNNSMCWGSVKINTSEIIQIDKEMKYWEDKLWNSEFSHAGGVATTKQDIITLYKMLAKTGGDFPVNKLLSSKLKLGDVL